MTARSQIRLGFVSDKPVHVGDGLWTLAGFGRLVEVLQARAARVTVALSRAPQRITAYDYRLNIPPEDFFELPWVPSIARGFFQIRSCRRAIRAVERQSDVVLVQLPFAAVWALSNPRRPRVYQVCANLHQMVATSTYYRGPKRLAAKAAALVLDRAQARLIRRPDARMVAHGAELAARYGLENGPAMVSSTMWDREILSVPRRRAADAPFRVLYVGFLRHEKGIDTLMAAFRRLLERRPDAELDIVGGRDTVEHGIGDQLRRELDELGQRATVRMLGHLPFGPQLFQVLADADVLAVPSRSEGTPRVLIEARAFGCTVVGSAVGGIPTSITNEVDGLLVPPNDPAALAAALLRIAGDDDLRRRLIAGGVERARHSTVEAFAGVLFDQALQLYESRGASLTPPVEPQTATEVR